ncbi:sterol carrier family protein [Tessaracoccus sp. OS52]|uniref:sterol carrier family protein n=1 Tax=Tessaracoccus sp. OS52 TaxID=2886691 RepID=UPI001D12F61B|nr:sterol carrier family protein [Tessaracoccus sp. OS52]MCC2593477.1 sterol carrier family protein [Tessaracoccus sp. OS52]
MHKPTAAVVDQLGELISSLAERDPELAASQRLLLHADLRHRRPDLTRALITLTRAAQENGLDLGPVLTAASTRAACALLGERHPGASIEVRVPPYAAVQIGFESGPKHTRGTPPNVVEMPADVFLGLVTGLTAWESATARLSVSGAHASEAAQAFPL